MPAQGARFVGRLRTRAALWSGFRDGRRTGPRYRSPVRTCPAFDRIEAKFPASAVAVLGCPEPWPTLEPAAAVLAYFAVPRG
ncbi:hypothetical protein [Streptomyces sp. NPDC090022]|uniref:hypothetical protein n=1 Tax=Streptomyces sp. NPDC090022 TaxID=3365920 RepID=UPI0037F52FD8